MKIINDEAMILAAGYGKRMLPLTSHTPKPLVKINNKSLLEHSLDKLQNAGIKNVVINTHHIHSKILKFVKSLDRKIDVIYEEEILDTGGGVLNAIKAGKVGKNNLPFFVINGDSYWIEKQSIIINLSNFWDSKKMDILLLLKKKEDLYGYAGLGDFTFQKESNYFGNINNYTSNRNLVYTGVQLLNPQIFKNIKKKIFSLKEIFKKAMEKDKLYGLIDNNKWFHVGNMKTLHEINFKKK